MAAVLPRARELRVTGGRALGRSRAYGVFAALYRAGVTAELLPIVAAIPELAAHVVQPFDAAEAAAAHQALFGFNVFPYQSVFLDESGLLGGAESERVRGAYRAAGFLPGATVDDPDHLAHELALLAFLCGAEADAIADGVAGMAAAARAQQAAFLRDYLLWWLPLFVPAVARQGDGFYAALAGLTWALVIDHWQDVGARGASVDAHWAGMNPAGDVAGDRAAPGAGASVDAHWAGMNPVGDVAGDGAAPGAGASEDAHSAGMNPAGDDIGATAAGDARQVVAHLLRPARCGLFLSRDDIARCARQAGLPHGFGDRRQMLGTALEAAMRFDRSAALTTALSAVVAGAQAAWATPEFAPAPDAIRRCWQARLARTAALISGLR